MVKIYTLGDGQIVDICDEHGNSNAPDFWTEHTFDGTLSEFNAVLPRNEQGAQILIWPVPTDLESVVQPIASASVVGTSETPVELPFEDWRQLRIDQVSAAICRLLAKTDWVEIRQADPDEPTKMSDEEFKQFRADRRAIRQMYEVYKQEMLQLEDREAIELLQRATLLRIQGLV